MADLIKKAFCASCQIGTDHSIKVVRNPAGQDEIIFSCVNPRGSRHFTQLSDDPSNGKKKGDEWDEPIPCGNFFKLPANLSKDELVKAIEAHNRANIGKVPASEVQIPPDHPVLKALEEL